MVDKFELLGIISPLHEKWVIRLRKMNHLFGENASSVWSRSISRFQMHHLVESIQASKIVLLECIKFSDICGEFQDLLCSCWKLGCSLFEIMRAIVQKASGERVGDTIEGCEVNRKSRLFGFAKRSEKRFLRNSCDAYVCSYVLPAGATRERDAHCRGDWVWAFVFGIGHQAMTNKTGLTGRKDETSCKCLVAQLWICRLESINESIVSSSIQ